MSDLDDTMVLFDWNGTLMADLDRAVATTNHVLRDHARPELDLDTFRERFRLPLAAWLEDLGIPGTERAWNEALAARRAPARPGAVDALTALRDDGALTGVVSAASAAAVGADLAAEGLGPCLALVLAGVTDKASVLREQRPRRRRALYVGDTAYDVAAARAAGYEAIAVRGGWGTDPALRAARPDALLDDLHQVVLHTTSRPTSCVPEESP